MSEEKNIEGLSQAARTHLKRDILEPYSKIRERFPWNKRYSGREEGESETDRANREFLDATRDSGEFEEDVFDLRDEKGLGQKEEYGRERRLGEPRELEDDFGRRESGRRGEDIRPPERPGTRGNGGGEDPIGRWDQILREQELSSHLINTDDLRRAREIFKQNGRENLADLWSTRAGLDHFYKKGFLEALGEDPEQIKLSVESLRHFTHQTLYEWLHLDEVLNHPSFLQCPDVFTPPALATNELGGGSSIKERLIRGENVQARVEVLLAREEDPLKREKKRAVFEKWEDDYSGYLRVQGQIESLDDSNEQVRIKRLREIFGYEGIYQTFSTVRGIVGYKTLLEFCLSRDNESSPTGEDSFTLDQLPVRLPNLRVADLMWDKRSSREYYGRFLPKIIGHRRALLRVGLYPESSYADDEDNIATMGPEGAAKASLDWVTEAKGDLFDHLPLYDKLRRIDNLRAWIAKRDFPILAATTKRDGAWAVKMSGLIAAGFDRVRYDKFFFSICGIKGNWGSLNEHPLTARDKTRLLLHVLDKEDIEALFAHTKGPDGKPGLNYDTLVAFANLMPIRMGDQERLIIDSDGSWGREVGQDMRAAIQEILNSVEYTIQSKAGFDQIVDRAIRKRVNLQDRTGVSRKGIGWQLTSVLAGRPVNWGQEGDYFRGWRRWFRIKRGLTLHIEPDDAVKKRFGDFSTLDMPAFGSRRNRRGRIEPEGEAADRIADLCIGNALDRVRNEGERAFPSFLYQPDPKTWAEKYFLEFSALWGRLTSRLNNLQRCLTPTDQHRVLETLTVKHDFFKGDMLKLMEEDLGCWWLPRLGWRLKCWPLMGVSDTDEDKKAAGKTGDTIKDFLPPWLRWIPIPTSILDGGGAAAGVVLGGPFGAGGVVIGYFVGKGIGEIGIAPLTRRLLRWDLIGRIPIINIFHAYDGLINPEALADKIVAEYKTYEVPIK